MCDAGRRCCCILPFTYMAIVYAASGITELVSYVKILFVLSGIFLFIFGFVKLALSLLNDNPGERVNSIIWLSVGVTLIVIKFTVIDKAIDPIITSINQHGHGW